MIFPWQESIWKQVQQRLQDSVLPHALMLSGQTGLGKSSFAHHLAAAALCSNANAEGACGKCKSCTLLKAGTHPDFFHLEPAEEGKQIRIDRVRELIEFMNLSCHYGHHKVAIIEPADAMNPASANSLLKTLEEPPAGALLILVTSHPSRLPITIRSRCQRLTFLPPSADQVKQWLAAEVGGSQQDQADLLAIAHGGPLYARDLKQNEILQARQRLFQDILEVLRGKLGVTAFSSRYHTELTRQMLDWILSWLQDLARLCSTGEEARLVNPDMAQDLRRLARVLDLQTVFNLQEKLYDYLRFHGTVNLNAQLVLEDILIIWLSALRVSKR
jgi:DNA polymerase III subunit delta'